MMETSLSEFISQTGADVIVAKDFLAATNWDVFRALKNYTAVYGNTTKQMNKSNNSCQQNRVNLNGNIANDVYPNGRTDFTFQLDSRLTAPFDNDVNSNNAGLHRAFSNIKSNARILSDARNDVSNDLGKFKRDNDNYENEDQTDSYNNNKFNVELFTPKSIANNASQNGTTTAAQCYIETPSYTFTLPNLSEYEEEFRKFLEKDLIETSTQKTLENSGHLNWWTENGLCQKLWPLATTGDGNCLLHAASLAMWGFHDRLLMLRKALHLILTKGSRRHALWRRWRWQQTHQNNEAGLIFNEDEWRHEWENVVRLASPQPRSKPTSAEPLNQMQNLPNQTNSCQQSTDEIARNRTTGSDILYESLEEIHVFALAHVLKRPIIVIADTVLRDSSGEAFAPILFGGVYLPLECCPSECHRSPLLLCYDAAHFSALVPMQPQSQSEKVPIAAIPITDKNRNLLTLHFCCDPGPDFTWWADEQDAKISHNATLSIEQKLSTISKYVDLIKLSNGPSSSSNKKSGSGSSSASSTSSSSIAAVVKFATRHKRNVATQQSATLGQNTSSNDGGGGTSALRRCGSTGSIATSRLNAAVALSSEGGHESRRLGRFHKTAAQYLNATTRATWMRFTRSLKKRLKSRTRASTTTRVVNLTTADNGNDRASTLPRATAMGPGGQGLCCSISLNDLRDTTSIIGAKLHTEAHHQFMNEMIENYLKAARQRFDTERNPNFLPFLNQSAATTTTVVTSNVNNAATKGDNNAGLTSTASHPPTSAPRNGNNAGLLGSRRERLSRSFSATSVVVKCMNGNCDGQGSHQTNFLCDLCFKTQKRLMESFSASTMATSPPRFDQSLLDKNSMTDDTKAKIYAIDDDEDQLLIKPTTDAAADNPYAVSRSTFYASLAQSGNLPCSPAKQIGDASYPISAPPSVTIVQPLRSSVASTTNAKLTPAATPPRRPSAAETAAAAEQTKTSPLQRSVYRTFETSYNVVNQVDSPQGSSICYYAPPRVAGSVADDEGNDDDDEPCCNLQCSAYDARCYSLCPKCIDRRRLEEKTNLEISNMQFNL